MGAGSDSRDGGGRELRVSREQALRYLVERDLFGREWRSDADSVVAAVRRLEYVQVDPVFVVERNHNLVLWSRLAGFRKEHLDEALYRRPDLVEVMSFARVVVPVEDYPLFRPIFERVKVADARRYAELRTLMEHVVERIREEGPLSSAEFEHEERVSSWWRASARAANQALNLLWYTGGLAVAGRRNNRQYFDLPERVVPAEVLAKHPADPEKALVLKYISAYGLGLPADVQYGWFHAPSARRVALSDQLVEEGLAVRVWVEGAKKPYYAPAVESALLAAERRAPGATPERAAAAVRFLAPLDNLLASRRRLSEVFGFDYTWEIYMKPEQRRYGPYTMPILYGDRLVGRLSPSLDREAGIMRIDGVWMEDWFAPDREFVKGMKAELREFCRLHGASVVRFTGVRPEALRKLGDEVKATV